MINSTMEKKIESSFSPDNSIIDLVDESEESLLDEDVPQKNNPVDSYYECPFCQGPKFDEYALQAHITSTHTEGIYNTKKTSTSSMGGDVAAISTNSLNENVKFQNVSSPPAFVCPLCENSSNDKEKLAEHLIVSHEHDVEREDLGELARNLGFLLCPFCRFIGQSEYSMQWHIELKHLQEEDGWSRNETRGPPGQISSSNISVTVCPMCGLEIADLDLLNSHIEAHFDTAGPSVSSKSKILEEKHPPVQASSSSSSSSSSLSTAVDKKIRDKKKANGYHYKHQYRQELERAVMKGELTPGDYYEQIAQMKEKDLRSGVDDGHSKVEGLIELVGAFYRSNSRPDQSVILCSPTDYYCGSYGDKGWGCGYRNFQMLISSLRQSHYSSVLSKAGKIQEVPSIPKIQEMIEAAWRMGFDPEGCLQLAGKVVHTRKWIGATEIVSILSSIYVRCELVDFPQPSSSDGTHPRMLKWVRDYFHRDKNTSPLPLYLQHQGHSRTIIGIEEDKGTLRLLLFDPASSVEHLTALKNCRLAWKQMGAFRRNLAAFKAKQYQIVAVMGLLDNEGFKKSKKLTSTRIV